MLTPENANAAILFLIQAGSLAASELKERWKLHRQKNEKVVDLSDQAAVEDQAQDLLTELSIEISAKRIDTTRELILEKQNRIYNWKRAKVLADKEFDIGRIPLDVLIAKKEELDARIREMMLEVENDIKALGLKIDREPI